ncbi:MAG TPA: isoprenyl transferase [Clostridiales bacterium]|nr:isoprenyl transferase [Clostridiales bacterium]
MVVLDRNNIPRHIAIIMDGNRRWAKKNRKFKNAGHREGMLRFREIVEECVKLGVDYLTVYAFSTENWGRENEEITYLMNLLLEFSETMIEPLNTAGVRINVFGNIEDFPPKSKAGIKKSIDITSGNQKLNLNIALSYGGRNEIVTAARKIALAVKDNKMAIDDIDEQLFSDCLYSKGQSDPDLLIRTSGEQRLSNFMLYQMAYTEFYFTEVLWPDFKAEELHKAIAEYQKRARRFGKE